LDDPQRPLRRLRQRAMLLFRHCVLPPLGLDFPAWDAPTVPRRHL